MDGTFKRARGGGVTYHVARSRRTGYTFGNCEKVEYRPESVRGGPMRPLS